MLSFSIYWYMEGMCASVAVLHIVTRPFRPRFRRGYIIQWRRQEDTEVSFVTYFLMNACTGITRLLQDQRGAAGAFPRDAFPRAMMPIGRMSYHRGYGDQSSSRKVRARTTYVITSFPVFRGKQRVNYGHVIVNDPVIVQLFFPLSFSLFFFVQIRFHIYICLLKSHNASNDRHIRQC